MANIFDYVAGQTNDPSIGDTPEQIQEAADDAKKGMGTQTNEQWGNESVGGGGSNVADKDDYGASMSYSR
jgi:hypothetical protein